ncbi:MAG TPA: tetratricopeptide repeat protein [Thermoanaerobaculia bacterium]|nr:tetratricopeptide repeat protein [Thermoanaerobaculia bacterium]
MTHIAERYLDLLGHDEAPRKAFLACSAAFRLDDDAARDAIALVARSNGSTESLLQRIKGLGCVSQRWDGSWYLTEEVRSYLADRLDIEVPPEVRHRLHEVFSSHAERRLATLAPDGAITVFHTRATRIESAYQKTLIPGREQEGGRELGETWLQARGSARDATAEAVTRIAEELTVRGSQLPDEVLFLRGMSAYRRGRRRQAEGDFRTVYERGRPGKIHAIAAHLFGTLVRDRREAKRALHRSLLWDPAPEGRAQTWHSLGNLVGGDSRNRLEAELAYRRSLELLHDPEDKAQVWHSLGNLLSEDRMRWLEAENAYRRSLELDPIFKGQGQVWHSLGNLLSKDRTRWPEAENAYRRSLELNTNFKSQGQVHASWADALMKVGGPPAFEQAEKLALKARTLDPRNPTTCGVANRVLADIYEARGQIEDAIAALEALQETDRQLDNRKHHDRIQTRIQELRQRAHAKA